ncbi:DUF5320 domain-containing protein [bacterium]|nr:DUF5320 domain-containing protein [candidate division CSSED10-310 bacterium]
MPGGDRTGPLGMGPRTGRAAGYCAGYPVPGFANPVFRGFRGGGWGRGFRSGFGRVRGRQFYGAPAPYAPLSHPPFDAVPDPKAEMELLKQQAEYFKNALEEIQARLADLSDSSKERKE